MSTTITNTDLSTRQKWVNLVWNSLERQPIEKPDQTERPLDQTLYDFYRHAGHNEDGYLQTAKSVIHLHTLCPNLNLDGNINQRFYDMSVSSRNNYIAVFLAGVIDNNLNNNEGQVLVSSKYPVNENLGNYWLERAWRSRFRLDENITRSADRNEKDMHGLMWYPLSWFIYQVLERNDLTFQNIAIKSLKDIEDSIPKLCQELHDNLTNRSKRYGHTYWGKDSEKWAAFEYKDLPKDMKENYILMILSGLTTLAEKHRGMSSVKAT